MTESSLSPDLREAYLQLEVAVRRLSDRVCAPYCSVCTAVCCRAHLCGEARESAFLKSVAPPDEAALFHRETGYLGPSGCRLVAGRPPVCAEYICSPMERDLGPERAYAVLALGKVLPWVGQRALGHRHLVVLDAAQLPRVNARRLRVRLELAWTLVRAVERFLDGAPLDRDALRPVFPVPPGLQRAAAEQ